jgi:hypothetical protein
MAFLALSIFIALYGFGHQYLGEPAPNESAQLLLFLSFVLGVICGFKSAK